MREPAPPSPARFGPPRYPLTGWPIQIVEPRVGYVWFVEPNVFVNQTHVARADAATANAVHDWIDEALAARAAEVAAAGGLVILHDWRSLEGYDVEARRVFLDRMRARPPGYLKAAHAFVRPTPLFRMAIQAANLVAALGGGGKVALGLDPDPVLARLGIVAPRAGTPYPRR